jgi:ATP-dependent metalloprotease
MEIQVARPDLKGRCDVLEYHLGKVKAGGDVDIKKIARSITGVTGAQLENLVNQAALKAAMDGASFVNMDHLEFARDKVLIGRQTLQVC